MFNDTEAQPQSPGFLPAVMGSVPALLTLAATNTKSAKMRSTLIGAGIAFSVGKTALEKYKEYQSDRTYLIKIAKSDPLYRSLQDWMIQELPETDQKNILAMSSSRTATYGPSSPDEDGRPALTLAYNGDREQEVYIAGHKVKVCMERNRNDSNVPLEGVDVRSLMETYIRIECPTLEAQRAVLSKLQEEASLLKARKPVFRTATQWGDFRSLTIIPRRPIETVVLKEGQSDRILNDLKSFLDHEDKYVNLGIPYHRGVLFHGEPGTGKTSAAAAMAYELQMDVYYISLSSVKDDSSLTELLSSVRDRSILLLEDIDVAHAASDRTDEHGGVTLSGLLNALDGFATPHGLITMMTTNHLEVLDAALVRAGRVDIMEEINAVDYYQVTELCRQFLGYVPDNIPSIKITDNIVAAEIVEVFKRHLDDPAAAGEELVSVLARRTSNVTQEASYGSEVQSYHL